MASISLAPSAPPSESAQPANASEPFSPARPRFRMLASPHRKRKGFLVAEPLSRTSKIIRVVLILILVVMIGAFVFERRAAGAAQTAFESAKLVAKERQSSEILQKEIGRKSDFEEVKGTTRELRWEFKGLIRIYTVKAMFNVQGEVDTGEEAHLDVFDKLKGQQETMETGGAIPTVPSAK
jgi:hypothetical protein